MFKDENIILTSQHKDISGIMVNVVIYENWCKPYAADL